LELVLVVGDGPDAANNDVRLLGHRIFDEQSAKRVNAQRAVSLVDAIHDFSKHLLSFFDCE
jgi:hypothetical protein